MGAFLMTRAAVPRMVEQGWGRVVNVTTSFFTMLNEGFAPYGPAKAALEAASAIWAKEFRDTGVSVNVLIPGGPTDTRMVPRLGAVRAQRVDPARGDGAARAVARLARLGWRDRARGSWRGCGIRRCRPSRRPRRPARRSPGPS